MIRRTDIRPNRVQSIDDLPVGTRIYYTGDVANLPWWGTVVSHAEVGLRIESNDLEHAAHVQHFNIGTLYEGHCNPRFVTEQAYKEWRERKIAAFKRAS